MAQTSAQQEPTPELDTSYLKMLTGALSPAVLSGMIADGHTAMKIGEDGKITINLDPHKSATRTAEAKQSAAQAMSAIPQGVPSLKGIFDPSIMNQLLTGQQQMHQNAMQIPQIVSNLAAQGAETEKTSEWNRQMLAQLAGQLGPAAMRSEDNFLSLVGQKKIAEAELEQRVADRISREKLGFAGIAADDRRTEVMQKNNLLDFKAAEAERIRKEAEDEQKLRTEVGKMEAGMSAKGIQPDVLAKIIPNANSIPFRYNADFWSTEFSGPKMLELGKYTVKDLVELQRRQGGNLSLNEFANQVYRKSVELDVAVEQVLDYITEKARQSRE